jgi:hypothetical protein
MAGVFCAHGVPMGARCRECDEECDEDERHAPDSTVWPAPAEEWMVEQNRFERWLDVIGGSR